MTTQHTTKRVGTIAWAKDILAAEGVDLAGPFIDITDTLQRALEAGGVTNDDYTAETEALRLATLIG